MKIIYALQDPSLDRDYLRAIFFSSMSNVLYIDTMERAKRMFQLLFDKPYTAAHDQLAPFMNLHRQIESVRGPFYNMMDAENGLEAMRRQNALGGIDHVVFGHVQPEFIDKKPTLVNPDRPKVLMVYNDKIANDDRLPAYRTFLALSKDFLDFALPMVGISHVKRAQDDFMKWVDGSRQKLGPARIAPL